MFHSRAVLTSQDFTAVEITHSRAGVNLKLFVPPCFGILGVFALLKKNS